MTTASRLLLLDTNIVIFLSQAGAIGQAIDARFSFEPEAIVRCCPQSHSVRRWPALSSETGVRRGSQPCALCCESS